MKHTSIGVLVAAATAMLTLMANVSAGSAQGTVKPPPYVSEAFSWDGWHVGAVGGYQWGSQPPIVLVDPNSVIYPPWADISDTYGVDAAQGGIALGWDRQFGHLIFGIDGDASLVNGTGRVVQFPLAQTKTLDQNWMATLRGRVGYASGPWLSYLTGGVAAGGFDMDNRDSLTLVGWIAGAGIERSIKNGWTFKVEGLYADYGSKHYSVPPPYLAPCTSDCLPDANVNVSIQSWMVRLGLNYKFH